MMNYQLHGCIASQFSRMISIEVSKFEAVYKKLQVMDCNVQ